MFIGHVVPCHRYNQILWVNSCSAIVSMITLLSAGLNKVRSIPRSKVGSDLQSSLRYNKYAMLEESEESFSYQIYQLNSDDTYDKYE